MRIEQYEHRQAATRRDIHLLAITFAVVAILLAALCIDTAIRFNVKCAEYKAWYQSMETTDLVPAISIEALP